MKTLLQIALALLLAGNIAAQDKFTISNLKFLTPYPTTLAVEEPVNFTYDYTQTADTTTVIVAPSFTGSEVGYMTSFNKRLTTPTGSNSGYVSLIGPGKIDSVIFKVYNTKKVLLYRQAFGVNYIFTAYLVKNIKFNPPSPDTLSTFQNLTFTYDYVQPLDTVKMIVIPTYTGSPDGAIRSPNRTLITKTGSNSGFVALPGEGIINSVNFKFYTTKMEFLYEQVVPVKYTFVDYLVFNIKFSPPSHTTLEAEQPINFTYDYFQSQDSAELIIVPKYSGPSNGFTRSGNEMLVDHGGSRAATLSLLGEGKINSVLFKFYSTKKVLLYEQDVPVDYTFTPKLITASDASINPRDMLVFPNPVNDYVEIRSDEADKYNYEIFNQQGTLMTSGESDQPGMRVATYYWAPGMYCLKINSGGKKISRRFIVQ